MTNPSQQAPTSLSTWLSPDWMTIGVAVLVVIVGLYKLNVRRHVAANGQVVTSYSPFIEKWLQRMREGNALQFLLLGSGGVQRRGRFRGAVPRQLSGRSKKLYSSLYSAQDILFGTLLYAAGLLILTRGGARLFSAQEVAGQSGQGLSVWMLLIGLVAVVWGVRYVVYHKRRNPFRDDAVRVG